MAGGTYGGHIDGSSGAAELFLAAAERPRVCNRHVGAPLRQSDAGKGQRSSCYAQDAKDDFDNACGAAENVRTKQAALRKFRGELVRLYQMQTEMAANAGSDSEKALTDGLLSELERISKAAHEAIGFTYTPLEQLAALQ